MQSLLLDPFGRDFAELAGVGQVTFENFFQHFACALIYLRYPRMIINVRIKKFSERGVRFPQIVAGMRNSLALAVIMMVLSEYFSSTSGVGYVLLISKNTFQLVPMWAAIVLIGVLGYVLNLLFLLVERRVLSWHRGWRAALPD